MAIFLFLPVPDNRTLGPIPLEAEVTMPLVHNPNRIRLAMLGMVDGNGPPYRWSAIINVRYVADMYGSFGHVNVYGTKRSLLAQFLDTFYAFKAQRVAFVEYLRSEHLPFPFSETAELMKIIIASIRSRTEGGRRVKNSEISMETYE